MHQTVQTLANYVNIYVFSTSLKAPSPPAKYPSIIQHVQGSQTRLFKRRFLNSLVLFVILNIFLNLPCVT